MKDTHDHRTRDALGKAQSTAERQARYRERRQARGERRVQLWLTGAQELMLLRMSEAMPDVPEEGLLALALGYTAADLLMDRRATVNKLAGVLDSYVETEPDEEAEER